MSLHQEHDFEREICANGRRWQRRRAGEAAGVPARDHLAELEELAVKLQPVAEDGEGGGTMH